MMPSLLHPQKILVANRGEIACRILKTLKILGIPSVAIYSDIDANAPHVWMADEAFSVGEYTGYLDSKIILAIAQQCQTTAIHPGYGFLSQNTDFAHLVRSAGLLFIGPSTQSMQELGNKRSARQLAEKLHIPVLPGASVCDTVAQASAYADKIGYPIILKAIGGGGGKGMRRVNSASELPEAFHSAKREAQSAFSDNRLLIEKYMQSARHIEVQIAGGQPHVITLGERECSLQRRYQKIIEESPPTYLHAHTQQVLTNSALRLAEAVQYNNIGTVEFLVDNDGDAYFLEVNSRLQVEHPVTEQLYGFDLVALQIDIAHGASLPSHIPTPRGHAIEARLNAEDPSQAFMPCTGKIEMLEWAQHPFLRIDSGIDVGTMISPYYDPLLAKFIAWGENRTEAIERLLYGLRETTLLGITCNQAFLIDILESAWFRQGETYTSTLGSLTWKPTPVPSALIDAARIALSQSPEVGNDDAQRTRGADRYSPWRRLGAFRT